MVRPLVALLCVVTAAASAPYQDRHEPAADAPVRLDAGSLPFFYDLYTFRGDDSSTVVVAAFAVQVGELSEEERGGQVRYRFDVSLVLADTLIGSVHRTDDSVFVAASRALPREHLLYTHIEMDAPPSPSTVHRVIMTDATTPGVGQLYDDAFPVPDYSGSELMLSDIALGQPGAKAGWKRGGATLALLPTSQFPKSSFEVFYEIYNLPNGNRYVTEIAVEEVHEAPPPRGTADEPIRLRFSGESTARADGSLQELRHVDASLDRGRYRLVVTITDEATGRTATRARLFEVRGWEPGATMVAALPRRAPARRP